MGFRPRRESLAGRSAPSLLPFPLVVLVGAVVGLFTLGAHQDAVHPAGTPASAHSTSQFDQRHPYSIRPAMQYLGSLAHHVHP